MFWQHQKLGKDRKLILNKKKEPLYTILKHELMNRNALQFVEICGFNNILPSFGTLNENI